MAPRFLHYTRDPAWFTLLASLALSFYLVAIDDLINTDGILYLESARVFIEQGLYASYAIYNWPFYSVLIASISQLGFTSLETSAHLLNAGFAGLLAFAYIRCIEEMGADRRVVMAAVVLLLVNVSLNGYRDMIIRDIGYWASFFLALWMMLKYKRTEKYRFGLWFGTFGLLATLFRIEGIIILLAGPLVLLWKTEYYRKAIAHIIVAVLPAIIVFVVIVAAFKLFAPQAMADMTDVFVRARLSDPLKYLQDVRFNLFEGISNKGKLLEETVLGYSSRNMGTEAILAIMFMMLSLKTLKAAGIVQVCLAIWAFSSQSIRSQISNLAIPVWFMILNLMILTAFIIVNFFMSGRYAISLALLFSLPAAFGLAELFRAGQSKSERMHSVWRRRGQIFIAIALVYMFLDGITSFSSSKSYLRETGLWLKENISADARLYSNEDTMYYYSGRSVSRDTVLTAFNATRLGKLPHLVRESFDYVAIKIGRKQTGFEEKVIVWAGSQPIYRSANERGDAILIFKLQK